MVRDSIRFQDNSSITPRLLNRRQKSTVIGALKKIKNGYIGGARFGTALILKSIDITLEL